MKNKVEYDASNYSYTEWSNLKLDWSNRYTVKYSVESYLFRYNNYQKGLSNKHIMKSTFGVMSHKSINRDIKMWYNRCIGAYNEIKYD